MAKQTKVIKTRITPELKDEITQLAKSLGVKPSSVIRAAAQDAVKQHNQALRDGPSVVALMNGQAIAKEQTPSAAERLLAGFDRQPITRNGRFYAGGLVEYEAKQKEAKRLATKGRDAGMVYKEGYIPETVQSWSDLDAWRAAESQAEAVTANASDLYSLINNILSDETITSKSAAIAELADGFRQRLDQQPAKEKSAESKAVLAWADKMTLYMKDLDEIRAILRG